MKSNNESGRSLVEMLGVLTIIGVLGVGVISSVNFGMESMRVAAVYDEVEVTAQGVRDLYSWQRSYPDKPADAEAMWAKICNNGVFDEKPADCIANGIETPWGKLEVTPGNDGTNFIITLTNVPKRACERLLAYQWKNVTPETTTCGENTTDIGFQGE